MRRLEFTAGTSNKFWEIWQSDTEVHTRWGRIGTDGQTKTKDFGTADKAAAAVDKQVNGKLKKGYAEVAASSAPADPPSTPTTEQPTTPPPEPTTPPPSPDAPFRVPESWVPLLHPRRDSAFIPLDTLDLSRWKRILEHMPEELQTDDPRTLDADQVSAIVAAMPHSHGWALDTVNDNLFRVLVHTHPLDLVVRLLLTTNDLLHGWRLDRIPGASWSRRALASASEEAYTAARDEALDICSRPLPPATSFRNLVPRREALAAYLFPAEPWWKTAEPDPLLATCITDVDAAISFTSHMHHLGRGVLETALQEWGREALPMVEQFLGHPDGDTRKAMVKLLVELPWDESVAILLRKADDRHVASSLGTLLERHPHTTLRVALGMTSGRLSKLVPAWILQMPEVVDQLLPTLDDAARAVVDKVREEQANALPSAELASLHPLFSDPPWKRKKTSKRAPLPPQPPPPFAMCLSDDDRQLMEATRAAVLDDSITYPRNARVMGYLRRLHENSDDPTVRADLKGNYLYGSWSTRFVLGAFALVEPDVAAELVCLPFDNDYSANLTRFAHPRIAERMLSALLSKTKRALGEAWIANHPDYAAHLWLVNALQKPSAKQRQAADGVRRLVAMGLESNLRAAATRVGPAAEAGLEAMLSMDPIDVLPSKRPKRVSFWTPAALPAPKLRDREETLPLEAFESVAMALAMGTPAEPYAGVEVLRQELDAESMTAFAWELYEQWIAAGAPSKESWALWSLGWFGNDRIAGQLTPAIRRWPGEQQHKRAVLGLDVLLGIGTDVALMHLNGIAQKVKFQGIKKAARERIATLADSLGLTAEQLADRLVPDLGLDADGTTTLNYGPRQFVVGFDEALKPYVVDGSGKRRASLPKPGVKDDHAVAIPEQARFKQLKKDVRTLGKLQVQRLENAMVANRRWPVADFERFLLRHPLLGHLVRRVIWAEYDDDRVISTFRVCDDGTLADVEDEEVALPSGAIGVAHPVDLSQADLAGWGDVLSDYELIQPFDQLGRVVHRLGPEERQLKAIVRNPAQKVPVTRILGLITTGWERGEALDAGVVHWMSLPLPDGVHEVRMNLGEAGIWTGMGGVQDEDPTIESVVVCRRDTGDWAPKGDVPFGELPPSLVSEVLAAIENCQQ